MALGRGYERVDADLPRRTGLYLSGVDSHLPGDGCLPASAAQRSWILEGSQARPLRRCDEHRSGRQLCSYRGIHSGKASMGTQYLPLLLLHCILNVFQPTATTGKTIEGSLAMLASQLMFMPLLLGSSTFTMALVAAAVISTLVEAHIRICENVIVPMVALLVLYLFG